MTKKAQVTSKDVAKLANVSQITVSRVFNPNTNISISKATRDKVKQAAKELNYIPNSYASLMKKGITDTVGVVFPSNGGATYREYLEEFIKSFDGYKTLLFESASPTTYSDEKVLKLLSYKVEVIVLLSNTITEECYQTVLNSGAALITINSRVEYGEEYRINVDFSEGVENIINFYIENNIKDFYLVNGKGNTFYEPSREISFHNKISKNSSEIKLIKEFDGDYTYNVSTETLKSLKDGLSKNNAICCMSDSMAYSIIDYLKKHADLTPGVDYSISGVDNNIASGYHSYNLTTIEHSTSKVAALTRQILDSKPEKKNFLVPMYLVVRESVCLANKI